MDRDSAGEQDKPARGKAEPVPAKRSKKRSVAEQRSGQGDRRMQDVLEDDEVREALGLCHEGKRT